MVDSLTRGLVDQLAGATDAARLALRQAELPDLLEALDGSSRAAIPDPVLHDMEELQSIGGAEHLNSVSEGPAGDADGLGQAGTL